MSRFVLDCSTAMAWCFEDESNLRADAVLASLASNEAIVPSVWPLEVANTLAVSERRRRVAEADIKSFLQMLKGLPIAIDDQASRRAFDEALSLARRWQLSAYDAAYLDLALRTGCPLASLDGPMNEAAVGLGVALFEG